MTFWNYMIKFCFTILSIPLSSLNLYSVYLLSNILYNMVDSFFIYSSILRYKSFLVIDFINGLDKNLSKLYLVVSHSAN